MHDFGFWSPQNISDTKNVGLEFSANYKTSFKNHYLEINANYSFVSAKDLETDTQLIYVPKNRANFLVDYKYINFNMYYQMLMNDEVYFLVDTIPAYSVSNLGFNFQFSNIKYKPNIGLQNISFSGQLTIFGHLHNILNDIKIKIINLLRFKGFNFY